MIVIKHKGNFDKTERFFTRMKQGDYLKVLDKYGQLGVVALASATPIESGRTASSWEYEISSSGGSYVISWSNSNIVDGISIAIILQYGHGTGTGGYVQGRDYINPAIRPIFDQIANDAWKEVVSS